MCVRMFVCVLMFVPLVHGAAAVCTEACISMGLEEGVCARVCVFLVSTD